MEEKFTSRSCVKPKTTSAQMFGKSGDSPDSSGEQAPVDSSGDDNSASSYSRSVDGFTSAGTCGKTKKKNTSQKKQRKRGKKSFNN